MSAPTTNRNTLPARVARLARKELRETLRDRRTIVTLVVMPLLVYPLLSVAFQRFVLTTMTDAAEKSYRVGFESEDDARKFVELLLLGDEMANRADDPTWSRQHPRNRRTKLPQIDVYTGENPQDAVSGRQVDLGVRIRDREELDASPLKATGIDCELIFDADSTRSRDALEMIERRLMLVNETFLQLRLKQAGVKGRTKPVEASRVRVEATSPVSFPLATLVPFVLILTTITGAVYPAIDLTAGERERGTLEMLIAAPVPRIGLLIAKYVAVVTVAMLTAVVNCAAMAVTVTSIGWGKQLFGERGLTAELAIEFCGLLLLFALFFSAVLLALTSFARSFKEAQAYLVPLMLASTAPGIFSMISGVRLTPLLAVTPLANIVLLARDMFEYNTSPLLSLLVLCSTLFYALAAILVAAKLFGSDAVLYGSPGSWSETLHPSRELRNAPTLGNALLTLAAITPVFIWVSNSIARQDTSSIGTRLGLAAMATLVIFAFVPIIVAKWSGVQLKTGLKLDWAPLTAFAGAILLGLSLWPFAHEIVVRQHERGWFVLGDEQMRRVRETVEQMRQLAPAWVLICMSVVPALAEELFFRGFLLSGLRTRQTARTAVITSAAIFGLFHVIVKDSLLLERFVPTAFLGLVLGWIAVRTASIWPGVVLHATHNGLLLLVAYYQDYLAAQGWGIKQDPHVPQLWLIAAVVVASLGAMLVFVAKPTRPSSTPLNN